MVVKRESVGEVNESYGGEGLENFICTRLTFGRIARRERCTVNDRDSDILPSQVFPGHGECVVNSGVDGIFIRPVATR